MGRHKTISDDDVLSVARDIFRAQGHTATTRDIAQAAGISEAILYQRFGSKDELFFTSMHARGPDIEAILGPKDPPGDPRKYLHEVVVRLGKYYAEGIPLALRVLTHPGLKPATLAHMRPRGPAALQEGLAKRLASLVRRKLIATPSVAATATLLASLAHDWALGNVFAHGAATRGVRELRQMVDVVWKGLRGR